MFLLCVFFAPIWGLEDNCLQQNFIGKSSKSHPKLGVMCSDTKVEDRWRGELIYEKMEGDSGIKIDWKLLVQKPDCPSELKFYVNDRELKSISPQKSKTHNSDWIELTSMENFELKVQAHYYTDPKCFEATKAITLKNNTDLAYNIGNAEAIDENEKHGEITLDPESGTSTPRIVLEEDKTNFKLLPPVSLPAFNENGTIKKDENGTVMMKEETTLEVITTTNSPAPENIKGNNAIKIDAAADDDDESNTTIVVACSVTATLVIIILVVGTIIGRKKCKSSAANEQEDIDENRVYGIYSDDADDDDYIVVQDTCPDYEPADVI